MNIKEKINKWNIAKLNPILLFLIIYLVFFVTTIVFAFLTSGASLRGLFFYDDYDTFMDFFNPVCFVKGGNPYDNVDAGAIYPPLCYVLYELAEKVIPFDIANDSRYMKLFRDGTIINLILMLIQFYLLDILIKKITVKCNDSFVTRNIIPLTVLFSAPLLFLYERGNILELALILLLFYIIYYDSENDILRELAFISLALSASIKIYPAIFGVLLVYQKRWRDAIKCALYGVFLFMLPFFHYDGFATFKVFLNNLSSGMSVTNYSMTGVGYRMDFATGISIFKWILGMDGSKSSGINSILLFVVIIILAVSFFVLKSEWKRFLCITILMIIIPSFGYEYVSAFYIIPFLTFIKSQNSNKNYSNENNSNGNIEKIDYLYAITFSLMLAPATLMVPYMTDFWKIDSFYPLTFTCFLKNISQAIFILLISIDLVKCFLAILGRGKRAE